MKFVACIYRSRLVSLRTLDSLKESGDDIALVSTFVTGCYVVCFWSDVRVVLCSVNSCVGFLAYPYCLVVWIVLF